MRWIGLGALVLAAFPTPLRAQSATTGAIAGVVTDTEGAALPQGSVTLTGAGLIDLSRAVATDDHGRFRFVSLAPGAYELLAEAAGFRPRRVRVRVDAGATASVEVPLDLGGRAEQVLVTEEIPIADATDSAVTFRFTGELLRSSPLERGFEEALNLAPGVTETAAYGAGGVVDDKYRSGATTNSYRLNGVDVGNLDRGDTGVDPAFDTIQQIQLVGVGARAEQGNFSGAGVQIVTMRGTNRTHGGVSWYHHNGDMRSDNSAGVPDLRPDETAYAHEASAFAGGPVVRGKLLAFGLVGRRWSRTAPFQPSGFLAAPGNESFTTRTRATVQTRLDWSVSAADRVSVFADLSPAADDDLGLVPGSGPEVGFSEQVDRRVLSLEWQRLIGRETFLDARLGAYRFALDSIPRSLEVPAVFDLDTERWLNSAGTVSAEANTRVEGALAVAHHVPSFLGARHEIRAGVELEHSRARNDIDLTGGALFAIAPRRGLLPALFFAAADASVRVRSALDRWAVYAQDDIGIGHRATLNLGLRLDVPTLSDEESGSRLLRAVLWSPRVGLTYDVSGNGRLMAHASIGRVHEKVTAAGPVLHGGAGFDPIQVYAGILRRGFDPTDSEALRALLTPENFLFSLERELRPIAPDLRPPHTDVLNVGATVRIGDELLVGLDYIRKRDRGPVTLQDRAPHAWESFVHPNPLTGAPLTLWRQTDALPPDIVVANSPALVRDHDLLTLTVQKRPDSRLNLLGSLTYQDSRGTVDNTPESVLGVTTVDFDSNPNLAGNPWEYGPVSWHRTWQAKLLATAALGRGFHAGAFARWYSGRPWAASIPSPAIPELGEPTSGFDVLLEPRGSRRTPAFKRLDVRVGKSFDLASAAGTPIALEIALDAFNVFNDAAPDSVFDNVRSRYPLSGEAAFGLPRRLVEPRYLRLGVRLELG